MDTAGTLRLAGILLALLAAAVYAGFTLSSIIVTLEPLFVTVLAWVVLGEVLGPIGIAGAVILTIAVVVASDSSRAASVARD